MLWQRTAAGFTAGQQRELGGGLGRAVPRRLVGAGPRHRRGAGGAASAVLCALIDAGVARIDLRNRSADRAEGLRRRVDPTGVIVTLVSVEDSAHERRYDVIINATSLGRSDTDALPMDLTTTQTPGVVLDVVYRTGGTKFVQAAEALGITAVDGREMLVAQGAAAFERWWNVPAPISVMRETLGL